MVLHDPGLVVVIVLVGSGAVNIIVPLTLGNDVSMSMESRTKLFILDSSIDATRKSGFLSIQLSYNFLILNR